MNPEEFRESPIGRLVPIVGTHEGHSFKHWAYVPEPLSESIELGPASWAAITEGMHALGKLDSAGKRVPNPRLVARPAIRREAVSTSALEGTYTTLPQILESEALEEPESRDVDEVLRFVRAAELGFELIRERNLSQGLMKELHARLMRGDPRCPPEEQGDYRKRQNFIGPPHRGIIESHFVPPPPGDPVQAGMDALERWMQRKDIPIIVRVALAHYQFETIHPFFDGNGRIGRLIMILQLLDDGKLTVPTLEISAYLESRRDDYQQHLRRVSATGDLDAWVQFIATGVQSEAERSLQKIDDLLSLQLDMRAKLNENKVRGTAIRLADDLIGSPVVAPAHIAKEYDVTYPAALNAIERLEGFGILQRLKARGRRRLYVAHEVLKILNR